MLFQKWAWHARAAASAPLRRDRCVGDAVCVHSRWLAGHADGGGGSPVGQHKTSNHAPIVHGADLADLLHALSADTKGTSAPQKVSVSKCIRNPTAAMGMGIVQLGRNANGT